MFILWQLEELWMKKKTTKVLERFWSNKLANIYYVAGCLSCSRYWYDWCWPRLPGPPSTSLSVRTWMFSHTDHPLQCALYKVRLLLCPLWSFSCLSIADLPTLVYQAPGFLYFIQENMLYLSYTYIYWLLCIICYYTTLANHHPQQNN